MALRIYGGRVCSTHKGLEGLFVLLDEGIQLFIIVLESLVLYGHDSIHAFQFPVIFLCKDKEFRASNIIIRER